MNTLLNFSIIQDITQGEWISKPENLEEILVGGAFDSRNIGDADIFFAWKGEKSDGHVYLQQLKGTDIKLVVVEKNVPPITGVSILKVEDSLAALQKMAKYLANGFSGKVVSITGSCGKTTAKTWLYHILKGKFNILTNIGSFNNHIGCPITILNMRPEDNLMILEMGTSGLGELELLSSIAPADVTVLLNVGHAHLGKFGSIENTYKAKLEIFSHQKEGAISIIPDFDENIKAQFNKNNAVYFGPNAEVFNWSNQTTDEDSFQQILQLGTPNGDCKLKINQLGDYAGDLMSAIVAICDHLNVGLDEIADAVATLPQEKGRLTPLSGKNGVTIIDDTYNANPESVINMLKIISSLKSDRYIGVIGNLAEMDKDLKDSAAVLVENMPEEITDLFLGGETGGILKEIIDKNFSKIQTFLIKSFDETLEKLGELCHPNSVIGIKGSRSSHMERYVYALSENIDIQCNVDRCGILKMCKTCEKL